MDKITIIVINKTSIALDKMYESIKFQTYKLLDVFIFTEKDISNTKILNDSRFTIIKCPVSLYKKYFLKLLKNINSDYLCFLQNEDVIADNKLSLQYEYLKKRELNICSCLEENLLSSLDEPCQNQFITSTDIDFCCNSSFIPLNPYTFMIKKTFLLKLYKLLLKTSKLDELTFTLLLLKYSSIEKIPLKLYKFTTNIIPYTENLYLSSTKDSDNPIHLFLKENFIDNRNYLVQSLNSKPDRNICNFAILIIIEELNLGGTETYILEMAKALKKLKIKTVILTQGGLLEDTFYLNSIKIIKNNFIFKDVNFADFINSLIKFYNINLIHCHTSFGIKVCKDIDNTIPVFVTLHGTYYKKDLIHFSKNYVNHFIFVSQIVKDFYFPNIIASNFHIVPNATLIESYSSTDIFKYHKLLGLSSEKKIFTYCSRLSNKKGILAFKLLLSFKTILKNHSNIILIIAGNGPYLNQLETLAKEINSQDKKIFILKSIFDIKELAKCSKLVIGTGRVALESLSVGTHTISFGLNGHASFVTPKNLKALFKNNFNDHSLSSPDLNLTEDCNLTALLLNYISNPELYNSNVSLEDLDLTTTAVYISSLYKNKSL